MTGIVIKGISGLFYVKCDNEFITCSARGKIKLNDKICAGDYVELSENNGEYVIEKTLPRRNFLQRPPVANVDQIIAVISSEPKPDFMLIDKMIVSSKMNNVDFLFCINKSDIIDKSFIENVFNNYKNAVKKIIVVSALTGDNISELSETLDKKISCFVGQSAVGKSSLANVLIGEKRFEIGELSLRAMRGKHTTRSSELIELKEGGYIIDTPGFSFFDGINKLDPIKLASYYSDFDSYEQNCKFSGCSHIKEINCGIKEALSNDEISLERYERYIELYNDLKDKWNRRYR